MMPLVEGERRWWDVTIIAGSPVKEYVKPPQRQLPVAGMIAVRSL